MLTKTLTATVASLSLLAAAPAIAGPAAALSVVGNARAGAATDDDSKLASGGAGIFAALLAAAIIAIPLVGELSGDDDEDDFPTSP